MKVQTGWFQKWECGCSTLARDWAELGVVCPTDGRGEFAGSMPQWVTASESATWGTVSRDGAANEE